MDNSSTSLHLGVTFHSSELTKLIVGRDSCNYSTAKIPELHNYPLNTQAFQFSLIEDTLNPALVALNIQNINSYWQFEINCAKAVSTNDLPNKLSSDFTIYPNPSTGLIHISKASSSLKSKSSISVFDLIGRNIFSTTRNFQNEIQIDLGACSRGIYLIKINDSTKVETQKIILQ